jgi:hypothetical protein
LLLPLLLHLLLQFAGASAVAFAFAFVFVFAFAFTFAFAFWLSSPKGICCCPYSSSTSQNQTGAPSFAVSSRRVGCKPSTSH